MKTKSTFLRSVVLSSILCISVQAFSSGRPDGREGGPSKKHVLPSNEGQASVSLLNSIERQFNNIERNIIATVEAMPEDKFYFSPESLGIKNSEFKGVRSFAGQIKHLATDNFAIWSPVTGNPLRPDIQDVNGPESIKTKSEIIKFLKDSFAEGRKAIATLTETNATEMLSFRGNKLARLDLAFFALTHANEHYGQMVIYLRMCGIIPPASRP